VGAGRRPTDTAGRRTPRRRPRRRARPGLASRPTAHPVIGFSEVQLIEQAVADYADTLAYLGRPFGCTATPSAAWGSSVAKARRGAGRSGLRRAAHRQDGRAVQGLRLLATAVVLDPGQAVHSRADYLRSLRPGVPTRERQPPRPRSIATRESTLSKERSSRQEHLAGGHVVLSCNGAADVQWHCRRSLWRRAVNAAMVIEPTANGTVLKLADIAGPCGCQIFRSPHATCAYS
jgi:hypothetical protein